MSTLCRRVVLTGPFGLQLAHALKRATDALIMEDLKMAARESVDRTIGDWPESASGSGREVAKVEGGGA